MEHICVEAQLCIKITLSIFKGIWNIDILINLCLGTSLTLNPHRHMFELKGNVFFYHLVMRHIGIS